MLRAELSQRPECKEAFETEAFKLNRLRHPNIVRVEKYGYCRAFDCCYFVMPLLDGLTLDKHLAAHGVPTAAAALKWLLGLLDGLAHAHEQGLIHRDVKPQNVIVRPDGTAVLIDFGIAGLADDRVLGISKFFAPPELHSLGEADARADLFMLAATLFYALRHDQPQRERAWSKFKADRVPEAFRAALGTALNADEDQRPATAADMKTLLVTATPAGASELIDLIPAVPLPPAAKPVVTAPPPAAETPGQRLKRLAADAAAKRATVRQQAQELNDAARGYLAGYDYAAAVQVFESFTPEQAEHRDDATFADAKQKRDRVETLTRDISEQVVKGNFRDPRLPVWVRQYVALDPTDTAMAELAAELPPPNDPPANPQPGDRYAHRVYIPDPDIKPGQLMTLKVSIPDPKVKPGERMTLKWKAVPKRANPNPTK